MFKQDWFERQIEAIGNTFSVLLFGESKFKSIINEYEEDLTSTSTNEDVLKRIIDKYLEQGDICKAEDHLFNSIKEKNTVQKLIIGLGFYNKINELTEEELKSRNFSKEEIKEGIESLREIYEDKLS